jgi:hypothetical protein
MKQRRRSEREIVEIEGQGDLTNISAQTVYTPPNAAREGCNIFDERTGKKSHVTQSNFYSAFGKKVEA